MKAEWADWTDSYGRDVEDADAALSLLKELENIDLPAIVEFYDPASGRSLGVGMGRRESVMTYQRSLDPPYHISLGNGDASGTIWFCYGNEESEYLARNIVPVSVVFPTVKAFFDCSDLPGTVAWEQL